MRTQWSFIKLDIKEICKNVKQKLFFSLNFVLFWKTRLPFIN